MPETKNVSGEYRLKVNGTTLLLVTPSGVTSSYAFTATTITGTTITASTQFVGTILTSNSTSAVAIKTSGGTQFNVAHAASATNYIQAAGANAADPTLSVQGTSTNIGLNFNAKNAGGFAFNSTGTQCAITPTASSVNYVQLTGGATGSPGTVTMSAAGTDSNINIALTPKGTGAVRIGTTSAQVGGAEKATILTSTSGEFGLGIKVASDGSALGLWQPGDNSGARTVIAAYGRSGASLTATYRWTTGDAFDLATSASTDISFTPGSGGIVTSTAAAALLSGTAIPAGGTAGAGLRLSSTANFGVFFGSGAPTLAAAQGSIYLRSDGSSTSTRLYVNTDGSTTWTNVTTAA